MGTRSSMADPDTDTPEVLQRAKRAQEHGEVLRERVAAAAEQVAEVEQESARVHDAIAAQGGPQADQARRHAEQAREVAAKEQAEADRLRQADRD